MPRLRRRSNPGSAAARIDGLPVPRHWRGRPSRHASRLADATGFAELALSLEPPRSGRRYLNEFTKAWQRFETIASRRELEQQLQQASMILVGDYHALPASQLYVTELLRFLITVEAATAKPPVLALECFYSRHQRWLEQWWAGSLDTRQLLSRTEFATEWGYAADPYQQLLAGARVSGVRVFGLDLGPRSGFHRLQERDRYMARRLAALRSTFPSQQIVVLIGESHLAPRHLPRHIRSVLPNERLLLMFQNLDQIYTQLIDRNDAAAPVRLAANAYCVFTAHPEQKYECFRKYLEAWAA